MLVVENPTDAELEHIYDLARVGAAHVEVKNPVAEVAPAQAADGSYWAKYELHGDPYAVIYFFPEAAT